MRDPRAILALDSRLKTFATQLFNQGRRQKRRDDGKPFVRPECIDALTDFRERLDAFCQDGTNIQYFELADGHIDYSSQRFKRSPAKVTSVTDHITAIAMNQTLACAIHQLARGVLFAASAGIC